VGSDQCRGLESKNTLCEKRRKQRLSSSLASSRVPSGKLAAILVATTFAAVLMNAAYLAPEIQWKIQRSSDNSKPRSTSAPSPLIDGDMMRLEILLNPGSETSTNLIAPVLEPAKSESNSN